METEAHRCSFCGVDYLGSTEIVFDPGSGSAICADCFLLAAESFSRAEADTHLRPGGRCQYCLETIEAHGFDPYHVWITSSDGLKAWSWRTHSTCIKASLHPEMQRLVLPRFEP